MSKAKRKKHNKAGLPPGSAVYTGHEHLEKTVVTLVEYNETSFVEKNLKGFDCSPLKSGAVTWYDVKGLADVALVEYVGRTFNVHSLAIEDILNTSQRPKWEDYDNGAFIIIRALRFDKGAKELIKEQISFYIEKEVLLTFQEDVDDIFKPVRERLQIGLGKIRLKGVDFLIYTLLDYIVDQYIDILDELEGQIQVIEAQILANFSPHLRSDIYKFKRLLSEIRRSMLPLRDVVSRFSREEGDFIHAANRVYVRDLYDHVIRVIETVENLEDTIDDLNDLFNSEQSNQTNHIFKVLTIISVIFIPPTFIVGVYGTNFDFLPEIHIHSAYFWMWGVMIFVTIAQLIYFRWKKWL